VTSPSPSLVGNAYIQGEKIKVAMALVEAHDLALIVKPGITEIADLRDRKIGVLGRSSDSYNILKWYMDKEGMDIETDAEVIEIPAPPNLITTFKTGHLDAVVLWGGYAGQVISDGGTVLKTYTDLLQEVIGHRHYHNIVAVNEGFLDDPQVAQNYLEAVQEIIEGIKADPEEAAQIWADFAEEPYDVMKGSLDRIRFAGDMNDQIKEDILAFYQQAAQEGYLQDAPGEDIFYTDWT
jgi:ABC-type nitrate/sulfonate/bicarbonate transport system substrate-binding protein